MEKERQAKTEIIMKKTLFPGKSKQVLTEFLPEKGIVIVPLLLLMDWLFHMYGIFFAATVTTVLSAVAALIFCYKDYQKKLKDIKEW